MEKIDIVIGRAFPRKVIPLIEQAKKEIDIIVYDWGWYPNEIGEQIQIFNNAIVRAHHKAIVVKAVVHKRLIKVILEREGLRVKRVESSKLLHTKLMIIDDEIAILGSHNYTKNAFNINYEVSVIIYDREIAMKFKNYFENFFY